MDINFEQLKSMMVFAQVVEQGSLSAAAKHLSLSRGVVSYHLKKLESHLGVRLLNRSTRAIALTEAGKDYYQSCRIIAEQASLANRQMEHVKNEPEGLIKLTCAVNVGLQIIIPVLNEFCQLYPKIALDVMLTDEVVNILRDGIDLAIRGAPLEDSGLQALKLASLPTCLCAAPEYLRRRGRPQQPADLANHDWVIYKLLSPQIELTKGQRSFSVSIAGRVSTNNAAARTAFVVGGHGLGRVPLYDARERIQAGQLEPLLSDYQLKDIDIFAVYPPGSAESKRLRLLLDYLQESFSRQQNLI